MMDCKENARIPEFLLMKRLKTSRLLHFFHFSLSCIFITAFLQASVLPQIKEINNSESIAIQTEEEARKFASQWKLEDIRQAIKLYLKAANQWEKLNEKNKVISCYREIGNLYIIIGEKDKALKTFEETLKNLADLESISEKSKLLSEMSSLFLSNGQYKESQSFFEQALVFANLANNPSSSALALARAGEFHYYKQQLNESAEFYEKSLNISRKINDWKGEAIALQKLGYVYLDQNKYALALEVLNKSLSKWVENQDLRGQATTLKAIGTVLNLSNEKQKALEYYQKAEKLLPKDIDYFEQATLYNSFGSIYEYYGDWKLSLNYRKKALDIFQKEKHLYGQLATLSSLGRLNSFGDKDELTFQYFKKAENLAIQLSDNYYLAIIKENLGDFYFKKENINKSLDYYKKSLQLLGGKLHIRQISRVFKKIGQIYEYQNNFSDAHKYFLESLELNQKVRDKFDEAETVYYLARLDALEGKDENALNLAKQSIEITESLTSDVLNSKLKSTYFLNVFERYELYINLLMKMHKQSPNENYAVQALQASEKSRARSLLETLRLSEANFTKDADPELVQKEKEIRTLLNLKADKLTELLSSNAEKSETDKLDNEINSLQNELEDIKGRLKANSPVYSAIKNPSAFDVQDFQANVLDDKTLLLEFSFGVEESYLWLVGKNEVNHFTLPKREILESRIQKLLDLLKAREILANEEPESYQKRLIDAESEFESEARLLSNELFGQIADKLGDKRLIIVPDGKLYYFPISALPLPNVADNTPMLETNEIIYEPSAATLQILGKTARPEKLSPKELLVFADPIFSVQDNRLSAENKNPTVENDSTAFLGSSLRSFDITDSNNQLKRLFATQEEAESIAKIVGAENATIASGFAANRQRVFEKDVSDYKIIHFATHGLMNDERPELSGIVLSLFDENGEAQKGFIRLQDIYSLNLSADLVVLSACQSGIGKEVKGEGLMSLTGGFIQSGANSVLSSLWKVDDYATAELMKNFYQELSTKNLAPSQALRNAQLKMRQNPNFKSPFYWAAFTVQGEFRHPISVNTNRFSYLWIVLATIFVGLLIWFVLRFVKAR